MVRILHTADWHLGYRQYGYALREGDFYLAAQRLCQKAIELKVDALLIAGDLFDLTKPPGTAVWVVQQLVELLKKHGIRVLAIDGNHDMADSNWLKICGIEPIGDTVVTVKHDAVELRVAGINACRPGVFYQKIKELEAIGSVQVLAIHQAVCELCDFPVQDFNALQMVTAMRPLGVHHVAMGDIHKYKETAIGGIRFCYSGSIEVNAVDEDSDKVASLIQWDGTKITTAMIPLQTRPFIVCRLETEADVDALLVKMTNKEQPFVLGWYSADKRDLANRAEAVLETAGCMYRIMPFSGSNGKLAQATFERKGAMMQLKDAVTTYFEETSDEFQLVFRLLDAPDNVRDTVKQYMQSKGLS